MGQAASRLGDPTAGLHPEFPPTIIAAGCSNVLINGIPAARVNDPTVVHIRTSKPFDPCSSAIKAGSATVTIGGMAAARMGDGIKDNDMISAGSGNVLIG